MAHARKVRLIGESRKKDDRLDAQALARLARIDPELLCPVKYRSAVFRFNPLAKSELLYWLDGRCFLGESFSGTVSSTMILFGDRLAEDTRCAFLVSIEAAAC